MQGHPGLPLKEDSRVAAPGSMGTDIRGQDIVNNATSGSHVGAQGLTPAAKISGKVSVPLLGGELLTRAERCVS